VRALKVREGKGSGYTIAPRFSAHRCTGAARPNTVLADVRTFILNEPGHVQERNSWQLRPRGGDVNFRRESRGACGLFVGFSDDRGLEVIVWFGVAFFVLGIIIIIIVAVGVSRRRSPLIIVMVADHRGPASGPQFVNAVNIGELEQVADPHINPLAFRSLT
jgi:hypothetical protein